jgi:hypothetical protein
VNKIKKFLKIDYPNRSKLRGITPIFCRIAASSEFLKIRWGLQSQTPLWHSSPLQAMEYSADF